MQRVILSFLESSYRNFFFSRIFIYLFIFMFFNAFFFVLSLSNSTLSGKSARAVTRPARIEYYRERVDGRLVVGR